MPMSHGEEREDGEHHVGEECSRCALGSRLMRRNREVIDFTRYRIKNYSKLTNFRKLTRIVGYNGK